MSPELYHGRTTQVEGRASLSRAWLYEHWYIGIGTTVETSISVYLAKVENIANDCPVMPVAAKSRTGLISTADCRYPQRPWTLGNGHYHRPRPPRSATDGDQTVLSIDQDPRLTASASPIHRPLLPSKCSCPTDLGCTRSPSITDWNLPHTPMRPSS